MPRQYEKTHSRTVRATVDIPAYRFVNRNGGLGGIGVLGVSESAARAGDDVALITNYSAIVEAAVPIAVGDIVDTDTLGRATVTRGIGLGIAETQANAGGLVEMRCGFMAADPRSIATHIGRRIKSVTDPVGYIIQPAGNNTSSFGMAINVPGGYDAVQLGYTHAGGGGACVGFRALVAATDDVGDKSYTATPSGKRFVTPWRNGVERNAVAVDGWHAVTWSGAATIDFPDAGPGNVSVAVSDMVPLIGIPDPVYPSHAPLLVRAYPGTGPFSRGSYSGIADAATYFPSAGPDFVMGAVRAGDAVSTPSSWPNSVSTSFGSTSIIPVFAIAYSGSAPSTVMLVGDSRFDGATEVAATRGYESFAFVLQQTLRQGGQQIAVVRAAQSGMKSEAYFQQGMAMLDKVVPTVAMYISYTVNDEWPTADVLALARQRTIRFIDRCQQLGVVPLVVSAYPRSMASYPEFNGNLPLLRIHDEWCASLGVPYFSPLKAYGDASGAWAGGMGFDADHMTQAGYRRMAQDVAPLLSPFI